MEIHNTYYSPFLYIKIVIIMMLSTGCNKPVDSFRLVKQRSIKNIPVFGLQPSHFNSDINSSVIGKELILDYYSKLDSAIHYINLTKGSEREGKFKLNTFLKKILYEPA